jgi:hypothetical protein
MNYAVVAVKADVMMQHVLWGPQHLHSRIKTRTCTLLQTCTYPCLFGLFNCLLRLQKPNRRRLFRRILCSTLQSQTFAYFLPNTYLFNIFFISSVFIRDRLKGLAWFLQFFSFFGLSNNWMLAHNIAHADSLKIRIHTRTTTYFFWWGRGSWKLLLFSLLFLRFAVFFG